MESFIQSPLLDICRHLTSWGNSEHRYYSLKELSTEDTLSLKPAYLYLENTLELFHPTVLPFMNTLECCHKIIQITNFKSKEKPVIYKMRNKQHLLLCSFLPPAQLTKGLNCESHPIPDSFWSLWSLNSPSLPYKHSHFPPRREKQSFNGHQTLLILGLFMVLLFSTHQYVTKLQHTNASGPTIRPSRFYSRGQHTCCSPPRCLMPS